MRPFLSALLLLALTWVPAWADGDDDYTTENTAKGVRPATPRGGAAPAAPGRPRKAEGNQAPPPPQAPARAADFQADDVAKLKEQAEKAVTVQGQVTDVYEPRGGTVLILNFGKDHEACFKAVIYQRNFDKWDGGKAAIKKLYKGQTVQVEGTVKLYKDLPQIEVRVPSQIVVVKAGAG